MLFDSKEVFEKEFRARAEETYGRDPKDIHITEVYDVLGSMVRDYMTIDAKKTKDLVRKNGSKQLVYFSMEFLIGRLLESNMVNLGVLDVVKEGFEDMGLDLKKTIDQEPDAGEGNGGLGRLAACFMDSIASLGLSGHGNCIRYDYGFFRQRIRNGRQEEIPDQWLLDGNIWEVRKPKHAVVVQYYGNTETYTDEKGLVRRRTANALNVIAIPCDVGIIGYHNGICNTLRLWTAEPSAEQIPDNTSFNEYLTFVRDLTHGLYPDDTTDQGKMLRLRQQYFLVSAGLQSTIRSHLNSNKNLDNLGDKYVFQLNDTHPILAIPELMRLLMDEHDYSWDQAFAICQKSFAFTNHTVMPEALEKWPVSFIATLCPRVFNIIEEFNRRLLIAYHRENLPQSVIDNSVIIKDGMVRMCQMAINVAFSVNGVAALHTQILESQTFADLYKLYPQKFNNKTNGITHRRWFLVSNPLLSSYVTSLIGEEWIDKPEEGLKGLLKYKDDDKAALKFNAIKQENKKALVELVKKENGIDINPDSIFDAQIKRLHAYKRQLMNIFRIVYLYKMLKAHKDYPYYPHTYIFGAKAAPSYVYAKKIIEFILAVAAKINNDPEVNEKMKVVFIENYGVSKAQVIIPASDVSEQISTAGKEASGTSNMKFMMNGALTLGTLDGANVEISNFVGTDNIVIFGLKENEADAIRFRGDYSPWDIYNSYTPAKIAVDSLIDGTFDKDVSRFQLIYDEVMTHNDEYFILKDFQSYLEASQKMDSLYQDRIGWGKKCLVNVAMSGYFSSDRTIGEYNRDIWHLPKVD